ncbi:hypothetical protein K440DRAFT_643390 [Wilcoxina mikolae CBS 423.85]|nr:hypothetical protein K440DRAFT_643390 [Wilcoxina mikolae CBS 423.85]
MILVAPMVLGRQRADSNALKLRRSDYATDSRGTWSVETYDWCARIFARTSSTELFWQPQILCWPMREFIHTAKREYGNTFYHRTLDPWRPIRIRDDVGDGSLDPTSRVGLERFFALGMFWKQDHKAPGATKGSGSLTLSAPGRLPFRIQAPVQIPRARKRKVPQMPVDTPLPEETKELRLE